jgi:intracellular multiplication protein IcmO
MPPQRRIFGVEQNQEQRQDELLRDIRSPLKKAWDAIMSREGFAMLSVFSLVALVFFPSFWPFEFGFFFLFFQIRKSKTEYDALPMRMPDSYNGIDYGGEMPAKGKYGMAEGLFYLGNDKKGKELWINKDDILTHMLILGTTGAGKTETLVSLAYNYLAVGSGFIYVDPKAAPKLAVQLYTMCRTLGRDDDFLVLNYMADKMAQETMRLKGHSHTPQRQSNTQNPFAVGTANQLSQLLFAMMPTSEGGNAIFGQNAQALISGLLFVLVELRDKGWKPLYIDLIRTYLMDVPKICELATKPPLPVSNLSMEALHGGLKTVGWQAGVPVDKQAKNFPEQYGYAKAYFGRALSLLIDNYGRIFKTSFGEVDPVDVITSRRVFLELIPSMDKDPKELKSLGQICLAGIRSACGVGLGDKVQGNVASVLGGLPTDARTPFGITVDEYAAIETPGFEILLTQGRGLGMAITVASQDFAGIKRASEAAAEQIVSNSKVKIFMTCEDPRQTYELIKSLAGEALVLQTGGFSVDKQSGNTTYMDSLSTNTQRVARVDFRDLQKQVEGQIHVFFKGELIRGKTFYANPPLEDNQFLRLNYFLKVATPPIEKVRENYNGLKEIKDSLEKFLKGESEANDSLAEESVQGLEMTAEVFERWKDWKDPDTGLPRSETTRSRPEVAIEALTENLNLRGDVTVPVEELMKDAIEVDDISDSNESQDMDDVDAGMDEIMNRMDALDPDRHREHLRDDVYTRRERTLMRHRAQLKDDFSEIGRLSGLSPEEADAQAQRGEDIINRSLRDCYEKPLPTAGGKTGFDVEGDIDALLASMPKEMLPAPERIIARDDEDDDEGE